MSELLDRAKEIVAHGPNTAYISRASSQRVRDVIKQLVKEIEGHDRSFEIRWNADMRAIKRWQAAHPGNDLVWPDHADLCVWLLEQLDQKTNTAEEK